MKSINTQKKPGVIFLTGSVGLLYVLITFIWGHAVLMAQEPVPDSVNNTTAIAPTLIHKSPRGAVIRAAIFPGWGQWYNGKKFKAVLAFGTEVGFLSASIWHNQRVVTRLGDNYKQDYKNAYREFHINMRNQYIWYLGGAILYAMADAYVDAHLHEFDESPNLAFLKQHFSIDMLSEGGFLATCQFNF